MITEEWGLITWFGVEEERMLRVKGVCLESRRSQGTEIMHLKFTFLANEPLSRAIFFAAYTDEEVREIHHWKRMLRMAQVNNFLSKYQLWRGWKLHSWRRWIFCHKPCRILLTGCCELMLFHFWWTLFKPIAFAFLHLPQTLHHHKLLLFLFNLVSGA